MAANEGLPYPPAADGGAAIHSAAHITLCHLQLLSSSSSYSSSPPPPLSSAAQGQVTSLEEGCALALSIGGKHSHSDITC